MNIFDPENIIKSFGLLGITLIVFAESGLLIGFMLPGDTLLFAAGIFAAAGAFSIWLAVPLIILAAIIGDNVGYSIGRRLGPRIFKKEDGILFRKEYVEKAEKFYTEHGGKTVTLARFVPIVRTFAPMIAGASKMDRKKFMLFNIAGGILWGGGVTLLGYFLGSKIPNVDKYIVPIMVVAMAVSFAGPLLHALRDQKIRDSLFKKLVDFKNRIKMK